MRKILLFSFLGLFSMQAFSQIPSYCLENDVVHRYLTEVQYDPEDYDTTRILAYCDNPPYQNKGVRKDHPAPAGIKLNAPLSAAGILYVSEWSDYAHALTMSMAKNADTATIYNLIPGRTYNWKVENDAQEVVASGKFKTTGTLRMLKIDNIYNVRDMGGWEGLDGYVMRYGAMVRGSRLNTNGSSTKIITSSGIRDLLWVGIRSELDMRNSGDANNAKYSFLGEDYPIYNVNNAYNSRIATFDNAPQSIEGVQKVIEWLKADKPVYFHCSVGADRTGTVAFLVGALCGMSEDALSKEFELTSFSSDVIRNSAPKANGANEVLIRRRDYYGRMDPNDNEESYKYAKMIEKVKKFPGNTLQEKVYYHLNTGAKSSGGTVGRSIPKADLDWLINYMLNPIEWNVDGPTLELEKGDTKQFEVLLTSKGNADPNAEITYTSSDTLVASVTKDGLLKAKGGGTAVVKVSFDKFERSVTVNVPLLESVLPDTVWSDKTHYYTISSNSVIQNGSFEYGRFSTNWKSGAGEDLPTTAFKVTDYENSNECYLEAFGDGDSTSNKSIRTSWPINKGTTYVFGFSVKNSTDKNSDHNPYLAVSLVNQNTGEPDASNQKVFEYPSYNGEWTDVQYVFTNTEGYKYIQVWFTHLSDGENNTCFDDFYLCRLSKLKTTPTAVESIEAATIRMINDDRIYNLAGQEVTNPGKGVYIKNGKKYIIK